MWRLLRKSRAYPSTPFQRIIYTCAVVHIFFIFVACFVQNTTDHIHVMALGAPDTRVVCMPSFMIPARNMRTTRGTKKQRTTQRTAQEKIQKQKIAKKNKKKITTMQQQKNVPSKKQKQKLAQQKIQESQKDLLQESEIVEPMHNQEPSVQKDAALQEAVEIASDTIYVNRETYQMFAVAQELQEALSAHWSPPAGMPAQAQCLIRVTIDAQGTPTQMEVVETSGIAVFDMAARTAVRATVYPKSVWGKTMVIHFNEEFA